MVTRERLHKFIRNRCQEIRHQVRVFCTTHDGEALHLLRVEVKKLRAALVLLQAARPDHHLQIKELKELYKAAGAIRTAQINGKLLKDLEQENDAFAEEQQRIIAEGSLAFCLAAPRYREAVHQVEEELEREIVDIKSQTVRFLFTGRIAKLSLFFSAPTLDTIALHNTRKETKELMYMYSLLPPALAASLPMNKDYLDRLQHALGSWHDNTVTQSMLQGFGQPDPALIEKLQAAEAALLQEIKDLTTGFDQKISSVPGAGPLQKNGQSGPAPQNAAASSPADQ